MSNTVCVFTILEKNGQHLYGQISMINLDDNHIEISNVFNWNKAINESRFWLKFITYIYKSVWYCYWLPKFEFLKQL